jgi:CheY-like chemotaxis protein
MPELNGFSTMKIMTLLEVRIPTIFVSAKDDISKQASKYPNTVGICKKIDLREKLEPMVTEALEKREMPYSDTEYALTQKEFMSLLGFSDRKKILLVEDSPTIINIMIQHLEKTGLYEIYHTTNGQEGIFKANLIHPDLIISDIEMPKVNGITMAQILYIIGKTFPIGFSSSLNDLNTVEKVMKLEGVRGYLIKGEVLKDSDLFEERVEHMLAISAEEKQKLKKGYENIDLDKLRESSDDRGLIF